MSESFAEYQARVLCYLGSRDPIRVQRATPGALERRLRGVRRAALTRRPAPTRWSIVEIVAHMADAELAMGWRLRTMLATPGVALAWWDQDRWAEQLGYAGGSPHEHAALFRALRLANLRLLASVPRAWWDECYGVHEVRGRQTVAQFVAMEAAHDLNHLRQIDAILRTPVSGPRSTGGGSPPRRRGGRT
jgi:hypothetical protein